MAFKFVLDNINQKVRNPQSRIHQTLDPKCPLSELAKQPRRGSFEEPPAPNQARGAVRDGIGTPRPQPQKFSKLVFLI